MVTLNMRGSRRGGGALKNHESIGFISNTGPGSPKQSQNFKASFQCRSIIGLPAKRH